MTLSSSLSTEVSRRKVIGVLVIVTVARVFGVTLGIMTMLVVSPDRLVLDSYLT